MSEPIESKAQFAINRTIHSEGGYVCHPADPGGATKYGITIDTLSRWRKSPVTKKEVEELKLLEAETIYYVYYWKKLNCDKLKSKAIATAVFDCGVLFGPGVAALTAQSIAREHSASSLIVDGLMGLQSIQAINMVPEKLFISEFISHLKLRVLSICERRPESKVFERGWQSRIDRMSELV